MFAALKNNLKEIPLFHIFLYNFILFGTAAVNNLILIPKFFKNKNVKQYVFSILALIILVTFIQGNYLEWLFKKFNTNQLVDFTPFAVTFGASGNFQAFQKYFNVFPSILMVLAMTFLGFVLQRFFWKSKIEEQAKAEQTNAELSLLKSQISPHFLFNVLNTLYALSLKKSDETPDVILKLSDILRYSLYETVEKEISINNEIHILKTYIDIESLRIPSSAKVSFDYDNSISDSKKIASMLLLPIIENAFKHGTYSTIGESFIKANLRVNEKLIFTCENSFKESIASDVGGIGLKNIRKRLQLLYPNKHKFEVRKEVDSFYVKIEIEL